MSDASQKSMEPWQVDEKIRNAIELHETRKDGVFVTKTEFEYTNKLRDQLVDKRLADLEQENNDTKDRNKWLFRLVIGAIIISLIPVLIALLSTSQGSILK